MVQTSSSEHPLGSPATHPSFWSQTSSPLQKPSSWQSESSRRKRHRPTAWSQASKVHPRPSSHWVPVSVPPLDPELAATELTDAGPPEDELGPAPEEDDEQLELPFILPAVARPLDPAPARL